MIMISISGYYNHENEFNLKEIYVSDDANVFILKKSESFIPYLYPGNVDELFDSIKNCYYPVFSMSQIKTHPDDDAKSLANFFMNKINSMDLTKPNSQKTLFDVLSAFGETRRD